MFVQTQDVLTLLLDPYGRQSCWSPCDIILSIFAQKTYPQLTFATLLQWSPDLCHLYTDTAIYPGYFN